MGTLKSNKSFSLTKLNESSDITKPFLKPSIIISGENGLPRKATQLKISPLLENGPYNPKPEPTSDYVENLRKFPRRISTKSAASHKFTVITYAKINEDNNETHNYQIPFDRKPRSNSDYGKNFEINIEKLQSNIQLPLLQQTGKNKSTSFRSIAPKFPDSNVINTNENYINDYNNITDEFKNKITNTFNDVDVTLGSSDTTKYPETAGELKSPLWTEIARAGRLFGKRNKSLRLIQQSGDCNVIHSNVDKRSLRFLTDLFTTLLELKWRYNILVYLVLYVFSWVLFALGWWAIDRIYGVDEHGSPCITGVYNFQSALLFSIETQQTIGYGTRVVNDHCSPIYFLLMVQSVFGAVTQCIVTGVIFSKLARPNRRAETIIFSKKAIIHKHHDTYHSLEFRVGDMRISQLIGVRINAVLILKKFLDNGQQVELKQERLKITTESQDDFYFLAWPVKIIHIITESSPLWNMTPQDMTIAKFEIIVVLEANCESTGGTVQVKTSYLPSEIIWGCTLAPLFMHPKGNGQYKIDYSRFNDVVPEEFNIEEEKTSDKVVIKDFHIITIEK